MLDAVGEEAGRPDQCDCDVDGRAGFWLGGRLLRQVAALTAARTRRKYASGLVLASSSLRSADSDRVILYPATSPSAMLNPLS